MHTTPRFENDPDGIAWCAEVTAMKRREIIGFYDTDAGRVIVTFDGLTMIYVPEDRPDALGHTGLCLYPTPGRPVRRGALPVFTPELPERVEDARTLADLEHLVAAGGVSIPASELRDVQRLMRWVGHDALRAVAVWRQQAAANDCTMQQAPERSALAARMRTLVISLGIAA